MVIDFFFSYGYKRIMCIGDLNYDRTDLVIKFSVNVLWPQTPVWSLSMDCSDQVQ